MHDIDLIATLTGCLAAALALGYLTHRVGLSPIVGYLLAGICVGPHTPGFVAHQGVAEQLAEIGVILLMFGVGLQFHVEELLSVRRIAVPGALVQSLVATGLGVLVARGAGWDWAGGIVFGLALSVASTVVLIRVLSDGRDLHTAAGRIAVGWLVVEDLFTVVVLVLLPALAGPEAGGASGVWAALGMAIAKMAALVAFTAYVANRLFPHLLERAAATGSRELFTLTVLVLALGIAVGSAKLFGVSMALGAFLAGMVVGRSEFGLRAASDALPMRDAFAVLFFVSVGMLFEPAHLAAAPGLAAATLAVVLLGKPAAALAIVLIAGHPLRTALSVSVALAQIGEFSFILAALGRQLGVLGGDAVNSLVAAAIVSITLNPVLYRLVGPAEAWLSRRPRLFALLNRRVRHAAPEPPADGHPAAVDARHRAVVVGYGPVGRTVARLLSENGIRPTVIDLNVGTVRDLQTAGLGAVYGDAAHAETLRAAGTAESGTLILGAAGLDQSAEIIRQARELNPEIRVLARSAYVRDLPSLRQAGAEDAFSGEGEVAMAMTESILRRLGATPEQIDRERARIHDELKAAGD